MQIRDVPPDPLRDRSLTGFSRLLREGAITAETATRIYLRRIAAIDPAIGAFRVVNEAIALERASEMDRERKVGRYLGPLMGMPIAVKEIFCVEGFPFGAGTDLDIQDLVPSEGRFVGSLKRAGCIVVGVTRTTEFAAATINSGKPAPWNPSDPQTKRVCGGSSHGSAAALAAGLCAFAIGSDSGGSVRLPAALCGQVGFKPSMGIWATDGVFPLTPTFDTVGTFTRSVADASLVFATLTKRKISALPAASELRLGRVTNLFRELDPLVNTAIERAIAKLADAGVRFVDIELTEAAEVDSVFGRILAGELVRYLGRERLLAERNRIDPVSWARIESELGIDDEALNALRRRQRVVASSVSAKIKDYDAIICPTTPLSPCPVAEVREPSAAIDWNRRVGRNTRSGNLFGQCGISLPVHTAGELPVGLQLLSGNGTDARLLAVAARVEAVLGRGPDCDLSPFVERTIKEQI